tara:strand:+ start:239 stop:400 length:162 start_codon:yes stop_codon:yes gene_type:complete
MAIDESNYPFKSWINGFLDLKKDFEIEMIGRHYLDIQIPEFLNWNENPLEVKS